LITMKEIGRLAGVSQSAVSMIINGKAKQFNISDETAQRVLRIAGENGFRPNHIARSMRTGRTGIVGIITSAELMQQTSENHGDNNLAMQLQSKFLLDGSRVMLEAVSMEDCRNMKMPEIASSGLAEFIIVSQNFSDEKAGGEYISKLQELFGKVVLVDDVVDNENVISVSVDNRAAGERCAEYLWEKGCRSFGVITCGEKRLAHMLRINAFQKRIAELSGGGAQVHCACAGNRWKIDCGGAAVSELLKISGGKLPDAILGSNDFFAYGAEVELLKRGFCIPQDTMLIGIGEWSMSAVAPVPLTTLSIDPGVISDKLLSLWKTYREGKMFPHGPVFFDGQFIERESTLKK